MISFQKILNCVDHVYLSASPIQEIQGELSPEETQSIKNFGSVRQEEFRAGRILARDLLKQLGIEQYSLVSDENRCPVWPNGITGSIAHTLDYCLVALIQSEYYRSIGVDLEIIERVKSQLWQRICTARELKWIQSQKTDEHHRWAALIFSAKEAFYKCQYMLTHQFLNFKDVEIEILPNDSGFKIHVFKQFENQFDEQQFRGHYVFVDKYVATLCLGYYQTIR